MQRTRAIPVAWLSSGLCPDRPKGWIPIIIIITDDTYCWLYDCLNVSFTVIFLCVCMFMSCSTSYCLVTLKDLWNAYVSVCICVCTHICNSIWPPHSPVHIQMNLKLPPNPEFLITPNTHTPYYVRVGVPFNDSIIWNNDYTLHTSTDSLYYTCVHVPETVLSRVNKFLQK